MTSMLRFTQAASLVTLTGLAACSGGDESGAGGMAGGPGTTSSAVSTTSSGAGTAAALPGDPFTGSYTYTFATPRDYFSTTFTEADGKFVEACGHAGGKLQYFDHRLTGADGEKLRAVVCHHGPDDAENVLFTVSGTHGVEGFAGSAVQIGQLMNPDEFALPAGWRVVHVHMVNPYGASWVLKENEDNADQLKNSGALYAQGIDNPILDELIDTIERGAEPGRQVRAG